MPTSALRDRLRGALVEFAWDEWAQMGMFAPGRHASPWAQDPEALIVMTLEAGRYDPRLFDELLDWLVVNEGLVSMRRLRSMCVDEEDRQLVSATTAWLRGGRRRRPGDAVAESQTSHPLFHGLPGPVSHPDPSFAEHGWLRPEVQPRGYSLAPDLTRPINLAFRLRSLLGTSARAEVVRALITIESPRIATTLVARTAGYARQNVHDALTSLRAAGVVSSVGSGAEQRYWLDRDRWAALFGEDRAEWPPAHRDWPSLLGALRVILRWSEATRPEALSEYMRGSRTRELLERVAPDLGRAGVAVEHGAVSGDAPAALAVTVERALAMIQVDNPRADGSSAGGRPSVRLRVEQNDHGEHVWTLRGGNGKPVAGSMEAFETEMAAVNAARAFVDRVRGLTFAVVDGGDGFHWNAAAPDGVIVARSGAAFASRGNATRAIEHLRRLLAEAPVVLDRGR